MKRRSRRDSSELPKTIRSKKTTIERSIRNLSESANEARESLRRKQKIDDAIFRFQDAARYAGVDGAHVSGILDELFRKAIEARNRSVENYRKDLETQAEHYRQKVREAQPRAGSYEHEIAMLRGRDRR